MKKTADVRFLGLAPSPALHASILQQCGKLDLFCANLTACRVFVELVDKHQRQGRQFSVRIDLTLPGHELTVSHVHGEDVYAALNDAFHAITRQLEDTVRRDRRRRDGPAPDIDEEHPEATADATHAGHEPVRGDASC